jgi:hypothetical protein
MVTSEFGWLRKELSSILSPVIEVRTQEYEAQLPLDNLSVLEQRISGPTTGKCDLVVHVIGNALGCKPPDCVWQHYRSTKSSWDQPIPLDEIADYRSLTYTQFESHLAVKLRIDQLLYQCESIHSGSEQDRHIKFLHRSLGKKPAIYGTNDELRNSILRDILHFALHRFGRQSDFASHIFSAPAAEFLRTESSRTKHSIENFSSQLISWPKEIRSVGWLERAEFQSLQGRIEESNYSLTLLIGPPGSGKSALLSKLAEWGIGKQFAVLGIKSDMLPKEISSINDLSRLILGGETGLVDKLRDLSASAPVLVLIDQLDALGSLSDLETGRLNAVLDFIEELVRSKVVHLVASVRTFELKADQRLSSLSDHSTVIELASLDETQVRVALAANSIDSTKWPHAYIEFLRTPYHLSLFLQAFDPQSVAGDAIPESVLFSSIQAIHDQRWNQLMVGRTTESSKAITDVLFGLGEKISATEVLWHPRTEFSSLTESALGELKELGWLTQTDELLGFAHQTQYEFVLAKRFSGSPDEFFAYVWYRRDRLTVRPVVWHVLTYLRNRAFVGYVQVMGRLLAQVERRHLQRLLLEFLAEVPNPSPPEVGWLRAYLESEKHYATTCWLIRSKRPWFDVLPDDCITRLMNWDLHNRWPVCRLLEAAIVFAFDRTKSLIRSAWVFQSDFSNHIAHILAEANGFDEETLSWTHAVCVDKTVSTWASQRLIDRVCKLRSDDAPRILTAKLNGWLQDILDRSPEPEPERENYPNDDDFAVKNLLRRRNNDDELESLLNGDALFEVKQLAEKVPREFVRCVWPWFCELVTSCASNEFRCFHKYRVEYPMRSWFGSHRSREYAILVGLEHALKNYAVEHPFEFVQLVVEERKLDSMTCQKLLAGGLVSISHRVPHFVLQYFLSDVRNLLIGDENGVFDSVRLFQEAVSYWTPQQQEQIQKYIVHAELLVHCEADVWRQQTADRLRGSYLICLPLTRRSEEAQELIARVLERSPNAFAPRELRDAPVMRHIGSPVNSQEMQSMSTEQLLRAINDLPDSTGHDHPTDWRYGGSEMLAEEFAEFAQSNPSKAIEVLKELKPGENEHVAGGGLRGLKKSKDHSVEIVTLIQDLVTKGFASPRFKDDVGQCACQLALDCQGLPTALCEIMETWLLSANPPTESINSTESKDKQSEADDEPKAVLWQHGGFYTLPNEYYWLGEAIKLGHFLASPPRDEDWYGFFERQAAIEFPLQVWEAWLWQLCQYVPNREKVAPQIANLLLRRTDVRSSLAGNWALACFFLSMEQSIRADILGKLISSPKSEDQQVAGEIATYVGYPNGDSKAKQIVDNAVANPIANPHILNGIAFAAAEMWTDHIEHRELSLKLLKDAFTAGCSSASTSTMSIFNHDNCLDDSPISRELLELAMNHLQFERVQDVWPLVRQLTKFMVHDARLTLNVCQRIVERIKSLGANETSARLSLSQKPLVSIALTIHRNPDPELAAEALTLFEDLLDMQAHDAFNKLRELDGRFAK